MNEPDEPQRRSKTQEYPCIWGYGNCPIRKQYKLKPESLAIFCGMCAIKAKKEKVFVFGKDMFIKTKET